MFCESKFSFCFGWLYPPIDMDLHRSISKSIKNVHESPRNISQPVQIHEIPIKPVKTYEINPQFQLLTSPRNIQYRNPAAFVQGGGQIDPQKWGSPSSNSGAWVTCRVREWMIPKHGVWWTFLYVCLKHMSEVLKNDAWLGFCMSYFGLYNVCT